MKEHSGDCVGVRSVICVCVWGGGGRGVVARVVK